METLHLVSETIAKNRLLRPGQKVIAAVSGGADSLCLLDCLVQLGFSVVLAHLDHRMREESEQEAERAAEIAAKYGLPAEIGEVDVRMRSAGRSLEEAARMLRYQFLVDVARKHGAAVVATGHTADDQSETVLMHFLRGAGPEGLAGMRAATDLGAWPELDNAAGIVLARPLLALTGKQTLAHCSDAGLEPIHDPSNLDRAFLRNRIRHDLLPELERYNPSMQATLARTASLMRAVSDLLQKLAAKEADRILSREDGGVISLTPGAFLELPDALQREVLRVALRRFKPDLRDMAFHAYVSGLDFIATGRTGARLQLTGGLELIHLGTEVKIQRGGKPLAFQEMPQMEGGESLDLLIPGAVELAHGWRIEAARDDFLNPSDPDALGDSRTSAVLDADQMPERLIVRTIRAGDRIQPLGMSGTIKVARMLMNEHIPRPARNKWPLVAGEDRVLWVVGLRMSQTARIRSTTTRAVRLNLRGPSEGAW